MTEDERREVKRLCAKELYLELEVARVTGTIDAQKISVLRSVLAKIYLDEKILAVRAERENAAAKIDADMSTAKEV